MVFPRLVLDERRAKANGTFPLVIRVTHQRKTATFPIGISISKQHWDEGNSTLKKTHPNFKRLHTDISNIYHKIQKSTECLLDEQKFTLKALKEKLSIQPVIEVEITKPLTFNEYANKLINNLYQTNKVGNAMVYQTALNRFLCFTNYAELSFEQINYRLLDNFKNKLIADGVKANTISNYFRTLRAIFNKAIKEKLVSRDAYCFTDLSFKSERTQKRAITKEELLTFANYPVREGKQEWHAKNIFLLSFSLIGISFTDLAYLKHSNINNGRVEYKRRKTGKFYSIKLTDEALKVLSYYSRKDRKYLLPILPENIMEDSLRAKHTIIQSIKTTNKYLNRIAEKCSLPELTTYVSRHTWATLAKRMGYSNELIAEAMGHEFGNKTTAIYLDGFEKEVVDAMVEHVSKITAI